MYFAQVRIRVGYGWMSFGCSQNHQIPPNCRPQRRQTHSSGLHVEPQHFIMFLTVTRRFLDEVTGKSTTLNHFSVADGNASFKIIQQYQHRTLPCKAFKLLGLDIIFVCGCLVASQLETWTCVCLGSIQMFAFTLAWSYFWCGFINGTPLNPTLYR